MSRRVRRGPIYKKRGRPSTKKQLRGLAILFGLAAIGSISGGVEIATTRSQTKIGASESSIPFAWIALTVICVVLMIVVCALYRKRFLDRAERLNLLINSYREAYQVARTTTDVTAYMDAMKNLRNWERLIAERKKDLLIMNKKRRNATISGGLGMLLIGQRQMLSRTVKAHIRTAIRTRRESIGSLLTTYTQEMRLLMLRPSTRQTLPRLRFTGLLGLSLPLGHHLL